MIRGISKAPSESGLSLEVRAVPNPGAVTDADPRVALEVSLRNGILGDAVWVEGGMSVDPGSIELELRRQDGSLVPESCRRYPAPTMSWDYVMLGPGDAISRLLTLSCYDHLPDSGAVWARLRYMNRDPHPPKSPLELVPLFRGPLVADPVLVPLE